MILSFYFEGKSRKHFVLYFIINYIYFKLCSDQASKIQIWQSIHKNAQSCIKKSFLTFVLREILMIRFIILSSRFVFSLIALSDWESSGRDQEIMQALTVLSTVLIFELPISNCNFLDVTRIKRDDDYDVKCHQSGTGNVLNTLPRRRSITSLS